MISKRHFFYKLLFKSHALRKKKLVTHIVGDVFLCIHPPQ